MNKNIERFIKYAMIDTQSVEDESKTPSSDKQFNLANILKEELIELGASNVELDHNCILTALIPATIKKEIPTIGFIAHIDRKSVV